MWGFFNIAKRQIHIDYVENFFMIENLKIGKNSIVNENCTFAGNVEIGDNCKILNCELKDVKIGNDCIIKNSQIEDGEILDNAKILSSFIEQSKIDSGVQIGPFAHLRPNCVLKDNVKVGNFVELKNCTIEKGTKIPHLSYVGDCDIGKDVNIGCGVIFCNYDGKNKMHSSVKDRVFIGSNSNIIAPVNIESDSFIAAGSTITKDIDNGEFAISRVRQENKKYMLNPYALKFKQPLKHFGTDGIRGIYGKDLTDELAEQVGFSLGGLKPNARVVIGRDTRESGPALLEHISKGLTASGAEVFDAGIISTAGLAYLTRTSGFDYGIEITASHNPSEYNGIKIFDSKGYKINESVEHLIEENLRTPNKIKKAKIQTLSKKPYIDYLKGICKKDLKGLKVLLDCSNGATSEYAEQVFANLNIKTVCINNGGEINKDAGVLDENIFVSNMKKYDCDIGFCFDGDADRVMCMTRSLKLIDGDKIMMILAKFFKQKFAVGTIMTNMAVEKALLRQGIKLVRTDVGDKYISKILKQKKYLIGAEQSGHVIISSLTTTGDGLLTALVLIDIYSQNKKLFEQVEKLTIYPTVSEKIKTTNKDIVKDKSVKDFVNQEQVSLRNYGRIIVRPSGTEPVVRVTVECAHLSHAKTVAKKIVDFITSKLDSKTK